MKKILLAVLCMAMISCSHNDQKASLIGERYDTADLIPIDVNAIDESNIKTSISESYTSNGCRLTLGLDMESFRKDGIIIAKMELKNVSKETVVLVNADTCTSDLAPERELGYEFIRTQFYVNGDCYQVASSNDNLLESHGFNRAELKPGERAVHLAAYRPEYSCSIPGDSAEYSTVIEGAPEDAKWTVRAWVQCAPDWESYVDAGITEVSVAVPH